MEALLSTRARVVTSSTAFGCPTYSRRQLSGRTSAHRPYSQLAPNSLLLQEGALSDAAAVTRSGLRTTRASAAIAQLEKARKSRRPVASLGGSANACTLLALAGLDADGDGDWSASDVETSKGLVEATKDAQLNAGVVAALVLSILFPLAYEEKEALLRLSEAQSWSYASISDCTSFISMQLAVSAAFVTVLISSRLYTQVAFWMPSLESQLWYITESSSATSLLEWSKNLTLLATLVTLTLETAVSLTWLDALAYMPLGLTAVSWVGIEVTLTRKCHTHLTGLLRGDDSAHKGTTTPPAAGVSARRPVGRYAA
jgi:hypothetical protein